jgi:hypothetical protein
VAQFRFASLGTIVFGTDWHWHGLTLEMRHASAFATSGALGRYARAPSTSDE